ncbi:MAG: hypothetical protein ABJP45_12665 [Cyclobacteriaceae bacterium]
MKTKISIIALFIFLSFGASASNDSKNPTEAPSQRVVELTERVNEIKEINLKELERKEKKALKSELKTIEKELKANGLDSKVSISIGAIIIILLLLIII